MAPNPINSFSNHFLDNRHAPRVVAHPATEMQHCGLAGGPGGGSGWEILSLSPQDLPKSCHCQCGRNRINKFIGFRRFGPMGVAKPYRVLYGLVTYMAPNPTLCYARVPPGRKSGFRARFRLDSNWESLEIGPPAGRRPAGEQILKLSRLESGRIPAQKTDFQPGGSTA